VHPTHSRSLRMWGVRATGILTRVLSSKNRYFKESTISLGATCLKHEVGTRSENDLGKNQLGWATRHGTRRYEKRPALNLGESKSLEIFDQGGWSLPDSTFLQYPKVNLHEQRRTLPASDASANDLCFVSSTSIFTTVGGGKDGSRLRAQALPSARAFRVGSSCNRTGGPIELYRHFARSVAERNLDAV